MATAEVCRPDATWYEDAAAEAGANWAERENEGSMPALPRGPEMGTSAGDSPGDRPGERACTRRTRNTETMRQ